MTKRSLHLAHTARLRTVTLAAVAVGLIALAGCSGSGSSDATSASGAESQVGGAGGDPNSSAVRADGTSGSYDSAGVPAKARVEQALLSNRAIIRTGAIALHSSDIASTVAKIEGVALTSGGDVVSESTGTNDKGTITDAKLQIDVPVAQFQPAVDTIAGYATLVSKQTSSQDVTSQVVDVASRVQSAKDSIAQLRTLYARAHTLGQVISLERELSQREANLESLQAQQRALAAQTTMSTIVIAIDQPPAVAPVKPKSGDHQAGFASGIVKGWDALVTLVVGFSHVVGLVLPLALLGAAAGLVGWAVLRRVMPGREEPRVSE